MIKRYDIWTYYGELQEDKRDNGEWVKYDDHAAELATLRAQLEDFKASQHYGYIGADGKPVLARSIEDDRDRLKAALREIYGNGDATGRNPQLMCNIAKDALK